MNGGVITEMKKSNEILNITFHNPNTFEETTKFLVKVIAENIADQIILNKQISIQQQLI